MARSTVRRVLNRLTVADCRRADLSVAAYRTAFQVDRDFDDADSNGC